MTQKVTSKYSPYFLQKREWLNFWVKANGGDHKYFFYENNNLSVYIYQYTTYFNIKFWYIPRAFAIKNIPGNIVDLNIDIDSLLHTIIEDARAFGVAFIKLDFDDYFTNLININNNEDIRKYISNILNYNILVAKRKIQFLKSFCIDISALPDYSKFLGNENKIDLEVFFKDTKNFWDLCNKNKRRYTRYFCEDGKFKNYIITFNKNEANFEKFWAVHKKTSQERDFSTQSKEYIKKMLFSEFGRLIIIHDNQGIPLSVFAGVLLDGYLVYLLGGNTKDGFEQKTQYLLQVCALALAKSNGCDYYDMGGYEKGTGYSIFKDGYPGIIRNFLGPIDIVVNPIKYYSIILTLDTLRSLIRKIMHV